MSQPNPHSTKADEFRIFDRETASTFLEKRGDPPPWRDFSDRQKEGGGSYAGATYVVGPAEREAIRAAFYLRRPLLLTGDPGIGKSSLAEAVAGELDLGTVLEWPITSRSTRQHGLYSYDAVGRLHQSSQTKAEEKQAAEDIGRFIQLGPLGTALYFSTNEKPRVLLIDELDKSDPDLPNDLLHVFEKGEFQIPELARYYVDLVDVRVHDSAERFPVERGIVRAKAAPFVIMTSNGEREFPPAFLRRCLRVDLERPGEKALKEIVRQKLGTNALTEGQLGALVEMFLNDRDKENQLLATDQLLNAAFLVARGFVKEDQLASLRPVVLRTLSAV